MLKNGRDIQVLESQESTHSDPRPRNPFRAVGTPDPQSEPVPNRSNERTGQGLASRLRSLGISNFFAGVQVKGGPGNRQSNEAF
jgi:hypothetical protein